MKINKDISLEIILIRPTPGVQFGLQMGSGNNYRVVQKQVADGEDLSFSFEAIAKGDFTKDQYPKFSGSFVQGPAGNKFIYICIGTYAGQSNSIWSRRLKVPLSGVTWEDINSLSDRVILEAKVPGTGKDGSPNCATVKAFDGWKVKK